MEDFVHETPSVRVVFGPGRLSTLPDEIDGLGLAHVLVLCTPGRRGLGEQVVELLGSRAVGVFAEARTHVPVATADAAVAEARRRGADGCVSVGGGAAVGLGKAVALRTRLPTVSVPTTYAGSEMTSVWGLTEHHDKQTGRDAVVRPKTVIYDPELTVGLDAQVSATSGVNALAHAVEALYAPDRSPLVELMAEESARCLAAALPTVVEEPDDLAGRGQALRGAWLAGASLGSTTMSLHHRLCHLLGGMFDLPHAATHTVMLPHVAAFNLPAAPSAWAALQRAFRSDDPVRALAELNTHLQSPPSLKALGLSEDELQPVADAAATSGYANPRSVSREDALEVLRSAWHGR